MQVKLSSSNETDFKNVDKQLDNFDAEHVQKWKGQLQNTDNKELVTSSDQKDAAAR